MQKVVLTNIPTRAESEKMYKLFQQAIRKNNTHCALVVVIALALGMTSMATARIFFTGDLFLFFCLVVSLVIFLVVYASVHSMEYECSQEWPAPYVYHKLLEYGQIIKSEVRGGENGCFDLCFTVSDNNCNISQKWCIGLEKVIRSDIKEWTVDLHARKVLIPYTN